MFLLADNGYPGYANMVLVPADVDRRETRKPCRLSSMRPSRAGWIISTAIRLAANALIKKDNPEMTDDLIAQAIDKMKTYGMAMFGDAQSSGLGSMTDARWKEFFDTMSGEGLYPDNLPYRDAYTLQFVNKGHGLDARKAVAPP